MTITFDQRTEPLPVLTTESGSERTVQGVQRWTRDGTRGHMEDPTLERTRAVWIDCNNNPSMTRGWYVETTDDQNRTTARSGPYDDSLALEYDLCCLFEYGIGATDEEASASTSVQKARDTRDTDLEKRGQTIIRLALELRIHQAADLWTAGIRERQAQLMFTRAEKITPTVAEVICSENETDADLQIASLFQELRDAAKALHHWHQG